MYSEPLINGQENRSSPKKKVNTLVDRSEFYASCEIDAERMAKLNDFTENKIKTYFF